MTDAWDERAWEGLAAELARWHAAGRRATFWWRDDDAGRPDPGLERLLGLAGRLRLPLAVAAVPAWLTAEVASMLDAAPPLVVALQHGWAHANHEATAAAGARKVRPAECGAARPAGVVLAETAHGWHALRAAVGPRALPVLVPPWNRIAPAVVEGLPPLGYRAVSAFGPRGGTSGPGFGWLNCHVDPIVWRDGKRFAGCAATLEGLRRHLVDRRLGAADAEEPTGLLTHHRDMPPVFWGFLETCLARLVGHPGAHFPPIPVLVDLSVAPPPP